MIKGGGVLISKIIDAIVDNVVKKNQGINIKESEFEEFMKKANQKSVLSETIQQVQDSDKK